MTFTGYAGAAAGLLVLASLTMGLARWQRLGIGALPLVAIARAALQLSVVAVLLRGVLAAPGTVVAFLALMLTTASWTARGRLRGQWGGARAAVAGVVAGSTAALGAILALRLVEIDAREVVAVGGIVVGNTMTAATLAGRNFARAVRTRAGEVEAWLALGALPARAHDEIARESAREALLPTMDQTRSTGLVTLPGAFVGALFGGASPAEAAVFQLTVLAGVALAMTVTGVTVTRILSRTPYVVGPSSER